MKREGNPTKVGPYKFVPGYQYTVPGAVPAGPQKGFCFAISVENKFVV